MAGSRAKSKQKAIAAILPGMLRDKGWERQLELHSIFPNWRQVVDETTAAHAQPLKIVKGTLWLEVENSAWLQQLQFQKVYLLETINAFLQNVQLSDIRFILPQSEKTTPKEKGRVRFVPPPPEEVQQFEKQVEYIEDQAARDSLTRLWYLSKACVRESDSDAKKGQQK